MAQYGFYVNTDICTGCKACMTACFDRNDLEVPEKFRKVYEFGGGKVREHLGGIYDFLRAKKIDSLQELERKNPTAQRSDSDSGLTAQRSDSDSGPNGGSASYAAQKAASAARRKREKQIADIEAAIARLEQEQSDMETLLADPANQTPDNFQRYDHIKREIEQRMYEWEILSEDA